MAGTGKAAGKLSEKQKKKLTDSLGSGGAHQAGEKLRTRKNDIDAVIQQMSGSKRTKKSE